MIIDKLHRFMSVLQKIIYICVIQRLVSTIITIRIDKETRRKIKRYKINISKVVRAALKSEIRRKERQELKEKLSTAKSILSRLT